MTKRQIIIVVAGFAILFGSFGLSGMMNKEKDEAPQEIEMLTAVQVQRLTPDTLLRTISLTGRLIPKQTVMLYAEVGGKASFSSKAFKEGVSFKKGETLLNINSDELKSSLISRRSNFQSLLASVIPDLKLDFKDAADEWEEYLFNLDTDSKLAPLPEVTDKKLKLFLSGRKVFSEYYGVSELETRFEKHTIRAPFSGSLTSTELDEGSLVRVNQPLGTFISSGSYETEAGVSYTEAEYLKVGTVFMMTDINTGKNYEARVARINSSVDPQTQQVKIYADVNDPSAISGIYLEGEVPTNEIPQAISIPLEALVGGDQAYFVKDSIAELRQVEVAFQDGERVILSGIKSTVEVVVDKHNESINGTKVAPVKLGE